MSRAMPILFDTHEYVQTLRKGGVPDDQAEAHREALAHAFTQGVATHDDIVGLSARMDILNGKIDRVETRLNDKIESLSENLNSKIEGFNKNLNDKIESLSENLNSKIEGFNKSLSDKIDDKFGIMKVWLYVIAGLVALTNPVAMHFYKVFGLLH